MSMEVNKSIKQMKKKGSKSKFQKKRLIELSQSSASCSSLSDEKRDTIAEDFSSVQFSRMYTFRVQKTNNLVEKLN